MSSRALAPMRTGKATQVSAVAGPVLQRQCACGQHVAGGECEECKKKRGILSRKAAGSIESAAVPPIVFDALRSPGWPLDKASRAVFEPHFGRDLSDVHIHTDSLASASARAV